MSNVYFTADLHLGHRNLVEKIADRPFNTIEEMDEAIISNWNAKVGKGDLVYILGDFAWCDFHKYARALNGNKQLILGNHDREKAYKNKQSKIFTWIGTYKKIKLNEQTIVMFHYPIDSWQSKHRGAWHLYGHVHNSIPAKRGRVDVGVDVPYWNFSPVSFGQLQHYFANPDEYPLIGSNGTPCNDYNCKNCGKAFNEL